MIRGRAAAAVGWMVMAAGVVAGEPGSVPDRGGAAAMEMPAPDAGPADGKFMEWLAPTTGEWLAAASKHGVADWAAAGESAAATNFTSRPQLALNLGLLLARLHVSAAARDDRGLANGVRDVLVVAEALGVGAGLPARVKTLTVLAEEDNWVAATGAIDGLLLDIRQLLEAQRDGPLVVHVDLGMFAGGLAALTSPATGLEPPPSLFEGMDEIVSRLRGLLPEGAAADDPCTLLSARFLDDLPRIPHTEPAPEEVPAMKTMHEHVSEFLRGITKKTP